LTTRGTADGPPGRLSHAIRETIGEYELYPSRGQTFAREAARGFASLGQTPRHQGEAMPACNSRNCTVSLEI
jgi:hypothetical protein